MRVLVCGGRNYNNCDHVCNVLGQINPTVVIAGGAKGADTCAEHYADGRICGKEIYRADWKTHGKKAGILRNIQMLEKGKPDLVVAFPGGTGTAHMVKIAKEANVEVKEIKDVV